MTSRKIQLKVKYFWFIVPLLVLGLGLGVYFLSKKPPQRPLGPKAAAKVLALGVTELKKWYELGLIPPQVGTLQDLHCPEELGSISNFMGSPMGIIDEMYLRCNPDFIECLLTQDKLRSVIPVRFQGQNFGVTVERIGPKLSRFKKPRHYQVISPMLTSTDLPPAFGYLYSLKIEGEDYHMKVLLENHCHAAYLPGRLYSSPTTNVDPLKKVEERTDQEIAWDNLNRHLFIDKFLVSNRDILEWLDTMALSPEVPLKLKLPERPSEKPQDGPKAAGFLNPEQMQAYCLFRGKQLLTAQVYDAATFLPAERDTHLPEVIVNTPYPWDIRRQKSFLYRMLKKEEVKITPKDCGEAYVRDCFGVIPYQLFGTTSASWIGIYNILGGPMEYLANPYTPELNLKAGSFYFHGSSVWQALGNRASWNLTGSHEADQFNWDFNLDPSAEGKKERLEAPQLDLKKYAVGFRCMHSVTLPLSEDGP